MCIRFRTYIVPIADRSFDVRKDKKKSYFSTKYTLTFF